MKYIKLLSATLRAYTEWAYTSTPGTHFRSGMPGHTAYEVYVAWRAQRNREMVAAIQKARPRVEMMPISEALQRGEGTRMRRVKLTRVENGVTYTVTKWIPPSHCRAKQS